MKTEYILKISSFRHCKSIGTRVEVPIHWHFWQVANVIYKVQHWSPSMQCLPHAFRRLLRKFVWLVLVAPVAWIMVHFFCTYTNIHTRINHFWHGAFQIHISRRRIVCNFLFLRTIYEMCVEYSTISTCCLAVLQTKD